MNEAQDSSDMASTPSNGPISNPPQSRLAIFFKSERFKSVTVRLALFVDGILGGILGALIGFIPLYFSMLADPFGDIIKEQKKMESMELGWTVFKICIFFTILYLIVFLIVLIFWKKNRRILNMIAGGILIISLIGVGLPMLFAIPMPFADPTAFNFEGSNIEVFLKSLRFFIIALALAGVFWWLHISALMHIFSKVTPPQTD